MDYLSLTVVILTKNEETNIIDVINNAKQLTGSVLVIDSGSTDKTVELAEKYGAKVVYRAWDNDFSAQRNFALEHVSTEWVLYLDADERLNSTLIEAIKKVLIKNENKQYVLKRKSVAFGQEFNYGTLKPDFVPRLFKTKHVHWVNKVHEKPVCSDASETLNGHIEHYTYSSWSQWFTKFDHYTTIWAQDAFSKGKKGPLGKAFCHSFFGFLQMLILKKGILDGGMGIVLCVMHFLYTLTKYLKLMELQRENACTKG